MSDHKDHIDQLTPDLMQQYLDGKLSGEMQHKVERYLLDHPFEAEAMEGFEAVGMTQLGKEVEQMKKDLFTDEEEIKIVPIWQQYWKAAAVVTVLLVSTFLILNLGEHQINSSDEVIALNEEPSATEEVNALDEKEVVEETVATDEISTKEESQDIITTPNPKVEQQRIVEVKEDLVVIEDEAEELVERSEALVMSDAPALSKPIETSRAKAAATEKAEVLSMIESDHLAEQKAMNNQMVVKREDTNISHQLSGKVAGVAISKRKQDSQVNPAKEKIVKGTITSAEDGSALPGVNVVVSGTTTGTVTDVYGNYEIAVPEQDEVSLRYSFIGYTDEEVEVGDRRAIDAELSAVMSQLSEVVVTATGIVREKKSLGYAVSKTKEVRKQSAEPIIGFEAYNTYLQDSLAYPQQAIDNQVSGKVSLELIISETGQISNVVVKEGLGYGCDEEAIRLIKEGPLWQNAIKRGNPVEGKVKIDVTFEQ